MKKLTRELTHRRRNFRLEKEILVLWKQKLRSIIILPIGRLSNNWRKDFLKKLLGKQSLWKGLLRKSKIQVNILSKLTEKKRRKNYGKLISVILCKALQRWQLDALNRKKNLWITTPIFVDLNKDFFDYPIWQ